MHLWSTASQQVNEGRVEGHDGISQVHLVLFMLLLSSKPTTKKDSSLRLVDYALSGASFNTVRGSSIQS